VYDFLLVVQHIVVNTGYFYEIPVLHLEMSKTADISFSSEQYIAIFTAYMRVTDRRLDRYQQRRILHSLCYVEIENIEKI